MDLTFDSHGTMLGVTTTVNPSTMPAILYRINPATARATKLVTLTGSNAVMGLAFGRDGTLYGTDFTPEPGPVPDRPHDRRGDHDRRPALRFSSGLELMNPGE